MSTMAEFARELAAEAEKRGLRIVIEPISPKLEMLDSPTIITEENHAETKAVSTPTHAVSVPKVIAPTEKERVKEANSWITVSQCARMLGVAPKTIYDRIRKGMIPTRRNGKSPMLVSTALLNGLPKYKKQQTTWSRSAVPVECVETGRRFESMKQASEAYGCANTAVQRAVKCGWHVKGHHFRKLES